MMEGLKYLNFCKERNKYGVTSGLFGVNMKMITYYKLINSPGLRFDRVSPDLNVKRGYIWLS